MSSRRRWRADQEVKDQRTKSESTKSTGKQNSRPNFCITTNVTVVNNSNAKTLIEYDIDETLDIKEEIDQDIGEHLWEKHNFHSERNQVEEKCIGTEISCNNSGPRTLIEYIDKTLDIKKEIGQEGHQRGSCNLLSEKNQVDEKYITSEVYSDSNSGTKTLIEYDYDESLEIKEGIIKEQEIGYERSTEEADIVTGKKLLTPTKEKIQESKSEPKKEYKCEKCARSYVKKKYLNVHRRFQCGVMPVFGCSFCGKKFNRKCNMNTHITRVHHKTDSNSSHSRHNCDKCSRVYSSIKSLNNHKRLEHAAVKPQFTCDFCGIQTTRKDHLSGHITSHHFERVHLSVREKKYKCEKCGHSFFLKGTFTHHTKFECDVIPQFSCEFCGKKFKTKSRVNEHILRMHQKTDPNGSRTRYECDKCSRSYSSKKALNEHKRIEQGAVRSEFICDMCGFQTKRKNNLSRHISTRHRKL